MRELFSQGLWKWIQSQNHTYLAKKCSMIVIDILIVWALCSLCLMPILMIVQMRVNKKWYKKFYETMERTKYYNEMDPVNWVEEWVFSCPFKTRGLPQTVISECFTGNYLWYDCCIVCPIGIRVRLYAWFSWSPDRMSKGSRLFYDSVAVTDFWDWLCDYGNSIYN